MKYAVADIAVPLDSVSQICDTGAKVVFEQDGGYIESKSGKRIMFERVGDTYCRTTWVPKKPELKETGFTRQGPQVL